MATKLHFTGTPGAALTFENKYTVEADSVIDAEDADVDSLLATGLFEKVADSKSGDDSSKTDDTGKTSDDSKKSKS